ncbi:MAG: hypothetical protein IPO07_07100 [Haliscomenobacter sp.]|nr:hypothetical protein [Haliscomenobacter sp.]MBK9488568.1 hypothetical protein [Haliscomenobacter sp.]
MFYGMQWLFLLALAQLKSNGKLVERANATQTTYWITVKNLTNFDVQFDLRYAILN